MLRTEGFKAKGRLLPLRRAKSVITSSMSKSLCLWMCKIAKELNLPLSWYFVRAFSISSYCWNYAQQCKLTQDMSTMLSQQHKLRDRIEGCHDQVSQRKSLASYYQPFHSTRIWISPWRCPCHCRSSCKYYERFFLLAQWATLEYRIKDPMK